MLTEGKQIAAARQLLDWSQSDLAAKAEVSKPSVIRMEKDLHSVKDDLRNRVIDALAQENIEFIEGGTRINKKIVHIIEGEDCYLKLMDIATSSALQNNTEILLSGADDKRCDDLVIEKTQHIIALGVPVRFLIEDGNTHIYGSLDQYRWMSKSLYIDSDVKLIYGNSIAYLVSYKSTPRVIIIEDNNIAEEARRTFEYIWDHSQEPSHTTADTKYWRI